MQDKIKKILKIDVSFGVNIIILLLAMVWPITNLYFIFIDYYKLGRWCPFPSERMMMKVIFILAYIITMALLFVFFKRKRKKLLSYFIFFSIFIFLVLAVSMFFAEYYFSSP